MVLALSIWPNLYDWGQGTSDFNFSRLGISQIELYGCLSNLKNFPCFRLKVISKKKWRYFWITNGLILKCLDSPNVKIFYNNFNQNLLMLRLPFIVFKSQGRRIIMTQKKWIAGRHNDAARISLITFSVKKSRQRHATSSFFGWNQAQLGAISMFLKYLIIWDFTLNRNFAVFF